MELDELSGRTTGRTEQRADKAGVHRGERTTQARDLRERADAPVRRPGLGARLLAMSDDARAGHNLQFRQRLFYLTINGEPFRIGGIRIT